MIRRLVVTLIVSILLVTAAVGMVKGATAATVTIPDEANIRSGAGTSFSVLRIGHKGEQFEVAGSTKDSSGRTWYKLKVGTGFGYVAGWLVTYTPAKATPSTPAPTTSPQKAPAATAAVTATAAATTRYAVATEDGTSIRSGPGTAYSRLSTIKSRTSLRVVADVKDSSGKTWYKVDCSSLKLKQSTGYVASWVVKIETVKTPVTTPKDYGASYLLSLWKPKVSTSARVLEAANLRTGPSVVQDRVEVLSSGASVQITGYALNEQNETWCRVAANGKSGWVYAPLLSAWEKVPGTLISAVVGKSVTVASSQTKAASSPFGTTAVSSVSAKGQVVTGVATDGTRVFVEVSVSPSTLWIEVAGGLTIGGAAPGGDVCSLTGIELVSSNGWTGVTMHVQGDKSGLAVSRAHDPERLEVSLPRLVQSAQAGIAGVPTKQVSGVKVWASSAGFVSKVVLYLTSPDVGVKQSTTSSSVQLIVTASGSVVPSKSVFLSDALLSGSDETFFAENATFVPLVDVANAYGILLSWDASNQQTSFTLGDRQYVLKDGLRTLKIAQNSSHWSEEMKVAPRIVSGLLYVPLSTISRVFGLNVAGDALRVYLDPIITSVAVTGASGAASREVTITSASDLKVTKRLDGDDLVFDIEGVPGTVITGKQVLASWATVSVRSRIDDSPPAVELRLHAPGSVADVQSPGIGICLIQLASVSKGRLDGKKIVLDPGHGSLSSTGYFDAGAIGPAGTKESTVNLSIAVKVKALLEAEGAQIVMTRSDDVSKDNPDLTRRAQIANSSGADLFVAIHQNATDAGPSPGGTDVQYWFDGSKILATLVEKHLVAALGRADRGIQKTSLYLVSHIDTMPAVLVECAFISNPEEERFLREDSFQQKAAQGIADAITEYFSR
ncbi:MAG: N-acetylmuramoyl-L-alanine amidase [Candidatus Cryosericum sp.]